MNKKISSLDFKIYLLVTIILYIGYCFGEKQLLLEADKLTYQITSGQIYAESVYIYFEPIYCKANKVSILEDKLLNIYNGKLTTCNKDSPHYYFGVKRLTLSPKKLIAKHLLIKVFGIPILYLPVYVHYLDDTRPKLLLTCGYKEDKIYLRVKYNYLINNLTGSLFIDFIPQDRDIGGGISYKSADAEAILYILKERYGLSFKYNKKILPLHANISLNFLSDSDVEKDYKFSLGKQKELKSFVSLTLDKNDHLISLLGMQSYEITNENKFIKKEELLPEVSYQLKPKKVHKLPIYYTINTNFLNKYTNLSPKHALDSDFKISFFNYTYFKNFMIKPHAKINYSLPKKKIDALYSLLLTYIHNNLKFDLDYKDYNLGWSLTRNFKESNIYMTGNYLIKDNIFKTSLINFYTKNLQISISETSPNNYSLNLSKKIQPNLTATFAYINNNNINLILNGKLNKTKFNIFYDLDKNSINFMDFSYNIDLHCIETVVSFQKSFSRYNYYLTFNIKRL